MTVMSVMSDSATSWTAAHQASLSFTISQILLKLMSIELVMPTNHLVLCHSLLLLPSIFPSISVFSNESALCIRWPKYWSFYFSISPSNKYSGLISFRIDCFDLLVVQGTLKSLLQHYSLKASILQLSAFFTAPDSGKYWGQKEKRASEDEMAGWHHQCNGHKLGQTSGDGILQSMELQRVRHDWVTEQQQQALLKFSSFQKLWKSMCIGQKTQ